MKVVVMGLGYIGLPTAALVASKGIEVVGVDIEERVVETINRGEIHIKEPDLGRLIREVVERKLLIAKTEPERADVFLIAVPTPFKDGYKPDLNYVFGAVDMILPYVDEGNLIIIESTCPVGTTEEVRDFIYGKRKELQGKIYISYCPERVLPGRILFELENNDRVIGGIDENSAEKAMEFYRNFVKGGLYKTNSRTAEMCKLIENAYRDVNVAFANEISMICDKLGIDVWELIALANKHPRVNILNPGPGVGGHCIAVDPWFIVYKNPEEAKLIRCAREVNLGKTEWVVRKISGVAEKFERENGRKPRIACLGLTYKPDVDDIRESPAIEICKRLIDMEFDVLPVDPNLNGLQGFKIYDVDYALENSDIVVFLVAHKKFKEIRNIDRLCIDFCGILSD